MVTGGVPLSDTQPSASQGSGTDPVPCSLTPKDLLLGKLALLLPVWRQHKFTFKSQTAAKRGADFEVQSFRLKGILLAESQRE